MTSRMRSGICCKPRQLLGLRESRRMAWILQWRVCCLTAVRRTPFSNICIADANSGRKAPKLSLDGKRRFAEVDDLPIATALVKILLASLAMGAAAWFADRELARLLPSGVAIWKHLDLYLTVRLGLAIMAAVVVLVATARALRLGELDEAIARMTRRFRTGPGAA